METSQQKDWPVPPGSPAWVTKEEIAETIRVWQPYYKQSLDENDALEILVNVRNLLEVMYYPPKVL